jgi:phosphomannomutase
MEAILQRIFKAYDMRGLVGEELTPELYQKIGQSFANWLPTEGAVAVGHDMRPSSRELADALIDGLNSQGRDVVNVGMITSEMIAFAVASNGLAGGSVVTASHNPAEYNGAKFCREEAKPMGLDSGLSEVRDGVLKEWPEASERGQVEHRDITEAWIEHVLGFIDTTKLKNLRIAVDAGNGMAGYIFAEAEPYLPFEVTEMYFEPDGTFPNHEANPMKFETLQDLIDVIKRDKLDGGIAFDGDGDRVFLVDETGTVLSGGVTTALLADHFIRQQPGATIIYDVRNSRVVKDVVEQAGGKTYRARVGHSLIKQAMREQDALFGGEASGHFFFRENSYADSGLIAALVALYEVSTSGMKLSEVRQKYSTYAAIPETNFRVADTKQAIEAVAAALPEAEQDRLDGISLAFKDAWVSVRASNTEPILRLNAEATSQQRLDAIVQKIHDLVSV